ncbi:Spore cortex-lytic enzyme precursor [compost metagenome]
MYELQGRLKYLGFYYGKLDSQFGPKTRDSLKWFQSEFGMKTDGVAGPKTKLKLYNATKDWKPGLETSVPGEVGSAPPAQKETAQTGTETRTGTETAKKESEELAPSSAMGLSDNDLRIMANAVYGEARGEPFEGQVAVAAVILNRVKSPSFPNTASGVIFQPGAFTAVADGQIWLEPNENARKAVQQALNGWDPSGGCLYYFNPETATSKWIWTRPQVKTIGKHIFCM